MTCLIIDDEAKNITLLQNMLASYCASVKVLSITTEAKSAVSLIQEFKPQLIFLDIEMPYLNGFELLQKLEPIDFEVIFVTAFSHYAIEAFEHRAIGYITKPINKDKLIAAVNISSQRVKEKNINKNLFTLLEHNTTSDIQEKIPLTTSNGLIFVKLIDILYCESNGNYTNFYLCNNKKIVVSRQLGEYEKLLSDTRFIRIHDKFIVQICYIKEYIKGNGGNVILENNIEIPLAARRKEEFLSRFEKWTKRKK